MRKSLVVAASVVAVVAALGTGGYLWVRAQYTLPGASCDVNPQCFVAAARRCAPAGIRIRMQGTESATDYVFLIRAGGTPRRCQVTVYRQLLSLGFPGPVQVSQCREAPVSREDVQVSCPGKPALIPGPPWLIGPPIPPRLTPLQAQVASAADCGGVHAVGLNTGTQVWTDPGDDPRVDLTALRCFAAAARTCAHAKIRVAMLYEGYGDEPGTNIFAIEKGGRPLACQVVRQDFREPAPRDLSLCHELSVTRNGVLLTCSGQHILIPLTVARVLR
jgi:hypothetical protein